MASDEVYEFTVVTPAATTQQAPQVTPAVFAPRIVDRIEYHCPAAALSVLGFQISMRGVPVIPANPGGFIIPHVTQGGWDLANHPDSGDWSITTFNLGMYQHSISVTFHVRLIPKPVREFALIPAAELHGEPDAEWTGY